MKKNGKSYLIYGSNPNQTGDGPFSLFPPMEKNVNVNGNSISTSPITHNANANPIRSTRNEFGKFTPIYNIPPDDGKHN